MRPLIVQKFGGLSLATPDFIRAAARRVADLRASGKNVIAVVSAMGSATDGLTQLAYSVSQKPNRRELDMLLSTGERVSMALFSMALTDALAEIAPEAKAISFTGSQAGILTDETHSNARIIDVKSIRVQEELNRGNVVILAGFQGVSPKTKEITTLGRGGTDVTAVALAAAFNATRCEILKEVPGVLSADPKIVHDARPIQRLTHAQLLDMTFWGAKVLHYRSVELAATHRVALAVGLAHPTAAYGLNSFTHIDTPSEGSQLVNPTFENANVLAVTAHTEVRMARITSESIASGLATLSHILANQALPNPQLLDVSRIGGKVEILFTAPIELLEAQLTAVRANSEIVVDSTARATVTVICQGSYSTSLVSKFLDLLAARQIYPERVLTGAMSVTFVVDSAQRAESVQAIHNFSA